MSSNNIVKLSRRKLEMAAHNAAIQKNRAMDALGGADENTTLPELLAQVVNAAASIATTLVYENLLKCDEDYRRTEDE